MKIRILLSVLLVAIFAAFGLSGCDASVAAVTGSDTVHVKDTSSTVKAVSMTCLDKFKSGTYAVLRHSGAKVALDAKGCFDFGSITSSVAARSASAEDTVVFQNDSTLFSLTIPFSYLGDTIQMMQTDLSIRGAVNGKYDSVIAIIYDSVHIKERKASMRKAYTSKVTDWSIKFYSPVNGNDFHVHFEYHKGDSSWSSELVIAEVGSSFNANDTDLVTGSVPMLDTMPVFNEYGSSSSVKINATSIYGIAKIVIDGKESYSFKDTAWGLNTHTVKVTDRAGYTSSHKINSFVGHTFKTINNGPYRDVVNPIATGFGIAVDSFTNVDSSLTWMGKVHYDTASKKMINDSTMQYDCANIEWNGHKLSMPGIYLDNYNTYVISFVFPYGNRYFIY